MSFTSLKFVLFFAVAAAGWYFLPQRLRRIWLLAASYGFYACAGARFLLFLLAGTAVSYGAALACEREWLGRRKLWTGLGAAYALGVLFLCKYFDFFAQTVFPRFAGLEIGLTLGLSFFRKARSGRSGISSTTPASSRFFPYCWRDPSAKPVSFFRSSTRRSALTMPG